MRASCARFACERAKSLRRQPWPWCIGSAQETQEIQETRLSTRRKGQRDHRQRHWIHVASSVGPVQTRRLPVATLFRRLFSFFFLLFFLFFFSHSTNRHPESFSPSSFRLPPSHGTPKHVFGGPSGCGLCSRPAVVWTANTRSTIVARHNTVPAARSRQARPGLGHPSTPPTPRAGLSTWLCIQRRPAPPHRPPHILHSTPPPAPGSPSSPG